MIQAILLLWLVVIGLFQALAFMRRRRNVVPDKFRGMTYVEYYQSNPKIKIEEERIIKLYQIQGLRYLTFFVLDFLAFGIFISQSNEKIPLGIKINGIITLAIIIPIFFKTCFRFASIKKLIHRPMKDENKYFWFLLKTKYLLYALFAFGVLVSVIIK